MFNLKEYFNSISEKYLNMIFKKFKKWFDQDGPVFTQIFFYGMAKRGIIFDFSVFALY